uniref:glycerol-3-phosphate dehydrogenase n=1 Tax=Macrostomum lignano TaxID=282301 RepID=A0A1I8JMX2_9PLAT
ADGQPQQAWHKWPPAPGVHISLPDYYSPEMMGLLDPATADGHQALVTDPNKQDTQSIARNHIIERGGKWTTYRQMSEEAIDTAIEVAGLQPKGPCRTSGHAAEFGVEPTVAKHLSCPVRGQVPGLDPAGAAQRASVAQLLANGCIQTIRIWESEVRWACQEYACRAIDILARRTRLAFTNVHAAAEALPRVVAIMAEELGCWSDEKIQALQRYLQHEMGYNLKLVERRRHPINLSSEEVADLTKKFRSIDSDNKGFITLSDMERFFKDSDHRLEPHQIREIIDEVDLNRNGRIEISEFLQERRMSARVRDASYTRRCITPLTYV